MGEGKEDVEWPVGPSGVVMPREPAALCVVQTKERQILHGYLVRELQRLLGVPGPRKSVEELTKCLEAKRLELIGKISARIAAEPGIDVEARTRLLDQLSRSVTIRDVRDTKRFLAPRLCVRGRRPWEP